MARSDSVKALHTALGAVRHRTVADALMARLATALSTDDLTVRALRAAVQLKPTERTVPTLVLAESLAAVKG